jgi:hypothetical protein
MTQPADLLAQLLSAGAIAQQSFDVDSRYYGLPVLTTSAATQDVVRYVSRRFVPDPKNLTPMGAYRIRQGDRIDIISGALLGKALSYWQICDANRAVEPDDVCAEPGTFITITLPASIGGG